LCCLAAPVAPPAPVASPTAAVRRNRSWLYGLGAAALALGLVPLVASTWSRSPRVPRAGRAAVVEPAAEPADAPLPLDPPDEPTPPSGEGERARPQRTSARYSPPELSRPDAPERVALEEIVRPPRPERDEAKRGQGRQKLSEEELQTQLVGSEE